MQSVHDPAIGDTRASSFGDACYGTLRRSLRTDGSAVAERARRRSVAAYVRVSAACVAFMGDRQEGQKHSGVMVAEVRRSERDAVVSSASSVPHHGSDLDRLRYPLE